MIKRIVKMEFRADAVDTFLHSVFEHSKERIRAFPGCLHMELLQVSDDPTTLFTLSYWESPDDLEAYRASEVFQSTWAKTKVLFKAKPAAWSVEVLDEPAPNFM
jgi:heme-degrading monooxygenase HmoA